MSEHSPSSDTIITIAADAVLRRRLLPLSSYHLHFTCTHSMQLVWLVHASPLLMPHFIPVRVEVRRAVSITWQHPRRVGTTPPVSSTAAHFMSNDNKRRQSVRVAPPCPGLRVRCVRVMSDGVRSS